MVEEDTRRSERRAHRVKLEDYIVVSDEIKAKWAAAPLAQSGPWAQLKAWGVWHETKDVTRAIRLLDLILEPEDAENAIGNLLEAYERRRGDGAHAKWWLWAQTFWIVLNRGIDLLGRVRKAWKAGE